MVGRKVGDAALQLISGVTQSEALRAGQTASARALRAVSILALRHPWPANTNALGATPGPICPRAPLAHYARTPYATPGPLSEALVKAGLACGVSNLVPRQGASRREHGRLMRTPYATPGLVCADALCHPWPPISHGEDQRRDHLS